MTQPEHSDTQPEQSDQVDAPKEQEAGDQSASDKGGLHWLRHAGVGPRRKAEGDKKISGADITSLGSLEAEIMGLLWEIGRPAHGMEVAEAALYKRRGQGQEPIAFSTVNTTLRRLADKGVLTSEKGQTRTPYYAPTIGREEMAARILNNVSETLLGKSLHGLLPRLVGRAVSNRRSGGKKSDPVDDDEARRLLEALERAAEPHSVPLVDTSNEL